MLILMAWFVMGFCVGVCASIGITVYLGKREVAKRQKRSKVWQEIKKQTDKDFSDEWGI